MGQLMKGKDWLCRKDAKDRKGRPIVSYPVMVESKHDEIRVHVRVTEDQVEYLSYAGKPLYNLQPFNSLFLELSSHSTLSEWDMGFEVNGNFNDSYRWVRSKLGRPDDLHEANTTWYIFGLPSLQCPLEEQWDRRKDLSLQFPICLPLMQWAASEQEVGELYSRYVSLGLEGAVIKQPSMLYERRRTDGWLKYKPRNTADGVIVGLVEAEVGVDQPHLHLKEGDLLGRAGSLILHVVDESGEEREVCPHGIPHELGAHMLQHREFYMGQWVEFFYMERDRQGGYRHPVFHRLREAK